MARTHRRYVRQMPKIYGNLQPRSYAWGVMLRRVLVSVAWLGGVGALLYGLFFSPWFRINKVDVQGAYFTSATDIAAQVPLGHSIWLFSTDRISATVLQDRRIQSVAVLRGLPDSVRIIVKERQPSLRWLSGSTVSILDDSGVAFVQYNQGSLPPSSTKLGALLAGLPQVTDTKGLPVVLEKTVVTPTFIQFIQASQSELHNHLPDLILDHIEIADSTYDVTFVAKQGMHIQLNTLGDAGVQIRNLTRLVHQKKASYASRVDLRIDRWAYVE